MATNAERKRRQRRAERVDWFTYWKPENLERDHLERGRQGFDHTVAVLNEFTPEKARRYWNTIYGGPGSIPPAVLHAEAFGDWRQRATVRIGIELALRQICERVRSHMLSEMIERELHRLRAAAQEAHTATCEIEARAATLADLVHAYEAPMAWPPAPQEKDSAVA
jgi:hypothetical protein